MGKKFTNRITIKYSGPDVDDGSMPVEDLLQALQGFTNAYSKISKFKNIQTPQQIRLVGLKDESFDLLISIIDTAQQISKTTEQLGTLGLSGGLVLQVIKSMLMLIKLTKHTQNKSFDVKINGNGNDVTIINLNNVKLDIPLDVYDMYKTKLIASDLNKITNPLEPGKIDETTIFANADNEDAINEMVTANEKEYFDVKEIDITQTRETWLEGSINTLTKSTNNGRFILINGDNVPFHLCMQKPEDYYHFFASKNLVRIKCIAYLDDSLKPTRLDIFDITESQLELFKNK